MKVVTIPRDTAAAAIGAALECRQSWVLGIPPGFVAAVCARLAAAGIPGHCYLDCAGRILRSGPATAAAVAGALGILAPGNNAAVATIPKTVAAARLEGAVRGGTHIPDDGQRDILLVGGAHFHGAFMPFVPTLLIDAIGTFDPRQAAFFYANDLARAS